METVKCEWYKKDIDQQQAYITWDWYMCRECWNEMHEINKETENDT